MKSKFEKARDFYYRDIEEADFKKVEKYPIKEEFSNMFLIILFWPYATLLCFKIAFYYVLK